MPPQNEVESLKYLSEVQVLHNICAVILDEIYFSSDPDWEVDTPTELSVRLKAVRSVLTSSVSPVFLESILNTILATDESVVLCVRYIALRLLLVEGVKTLIVGHFPEHYYSAVLEVVAASAADLERLDLRGIWVRQQDKFALCKALRRLHNIKHLVLRYVCDDELLKIVGKHCQELTRLDISGSESIGELGVDSLINNQRIISREESHISRSLIIVDIGGAGASKLSPEFASKLILGLPNLESLGSFTKTGKALECAYQSRRMGTFKLRYIHDNGTTGATLSLIVQTCPDLQAVYLDSPGKVAVQNLHMLKKMTELKLRRVSWTEFSKLLSICGHQLKHLFVLTIWGQFDLGKLGCQCPNLRRLELHNVSLSCSDIFDETALKLVKDLLIYNSPISPTTFNLIVKQSIAMEHLSLGECNRLTDTDVISSLDVSPDGSVQSQLPNSFKSLKELESIWFGSADQLTMQSLQAFLERCPKLSSIGNTYAWALHPAEVTFIRMQLLMTNTNLTLHEYGQDDEADGNFVIVLPDG